MIKELESLTAKVETVVDDLQAARNSNEDLLKENKRLEERLDSLEKQMAKGQKEGERNAELLAENKEYKKKFSLLKTKVASMLAKAEDLQ
jgi:cell division septum initiation protein DivIVA